MTTTGTLLERARDRAGHRLPTVWSLIGSGAGVISGYVITYTATTSLSKTDAGVFFTAVALFMMGMRVLTLGADATLVRVAADSASANTASALRRVLRSVGTWCTVAVIVVAVAFRLPGLGSAHGLPFGRLSITAYAVFLFALLGAVHAANQLAVSRGLGGLRDTVVIDGIARPLLQLAATMVALLAGLSLSVVCAAWALPFVVSAAAAATVVRRKLVAKDRDAAGPTAGTEVGAFWTYTRPRSVGAVLTACLDRLDIVLAALLISPAAAAVYTVASRLVSFAVFPDQAVSQAYQPRMARAAAREDRAAMQRLSRSSAWESLILAGPIYLVLISFESVLMRHYDGGHYSGARDALIVLAVGGLLGSLPGPVDKTLILLGSTTASLASGVASVATLIGLAVALTPNHGILGVAIAMSSATVVRNVVSIAVLHQRWSIQPISGRLVIAGVALSLGLVGLPAAIAALSQSSLSAGPALLGVVVTLGAAAQVWRVRRRQHEPAP
jgi:O-antigen/teichoic acid export membrane protein